MTDKKDHIINHAVELFSEKGFEGTTIRDLATKAGVNVAMVNYYFGSKEKLFEAMVERKASYTRGVLDEIAKSSLLTDIEKIDQIIETYIGKLFSNPKFHRVIHQEMMLSHRESLQQTIVNILYANCLIIKEIIETGIKKGTFRNVDPPLVLATLFGTINQVLLSNRMCNKLLNMEDLYVPYEDENFKHRFSEYLKQLMHTYLLVNQTKD